MLQKLSKGPRQPCFLKNVGGETVNEIHKVKKFGFRKPKVGRSGYRKQVSFLDGLRVILNTSRTMLHYFSSILKQLHSSIAHTGSYV